MFLCKYSHFFTKLKFLQDFEVEKYKQQQQQWKNFVSEQQKLEEVLDVLNSFSYDSESDTDDSFAPAISSRGTRSYGVTRVTKKSN